GVDVDPEAITIRIGEVPVVSGGVGLGSEAEEAAHKVMALREFVVAIDLNLGEGAVVIWTTDLGYEYVRANVTYRS
ncbi:MAG: bifunctional ornithine acetyltransferase/N-acetylglutamate synthase, partial [Candidatus Methylomirabilales bacterium]